MKDTPNKAEGRDGKKFLRTQAYIIWEKLGRALARLSEKKLNEGEWEEKSLSEGERWGERLRKETESIKNILNKSELLVKRAIVWDIRSYTKKILWEEKLIVQFECKYGLGITVDNLNSLLEFCAIHGFIPMVDKIYIDSDEWPIDITEVKELYTLFAFAITKSSNPLISNALANEVNKLEEKSQWPAKAVLDYLQQIIWYATFTYQYLLWDWLQKLTNIWTLSENIFAEIAIRIENQLRDKIWIESTYLKLAWYKDDVERKTDMDFIIKKTPNQSYQFIPLQFTTGSSRSKERSIEDYLIKWINEWSNEGSFIVFCVNGEFSKYITHGEKDDRLFLNKEYSAWINNPIEREKNVWSRFPLFIDSIHPKIIQPAEIMYIALHMLYKKYNFRYSEKDTYLNSFKPSWKIDKYNHQDINDIKLSDIFIKECSISKINNPRPDYPWILKHKFIISYLWEDVWTIVIYEMFKH